VLATSSRDSVAVHFWGARRALRTRGEGWTILVRVMVGLDVFLREGIQKLAFSQILGAGRFANIGIPYPEVMGPFVNTVEVVCGTLVILGLLTRLAAIPLIVIMLVAIVSTKLPIWAGHDIWIFHMPKLARYGFCSMAHESRDDFLMLLGSALARGLWTPCSPADAAPYIRPRSGTAMIDRRSFLNMPDAMEAMKPMYTVHEGRRYRLIFRNASDDIHPLHLHRHSFELTRIAGKPTAGVINDVVMLGGFQELAFDFVADNPGLTIFHCHQQLHMDFGFMALFNYA
jgi:uncharacterized membrane protein YphA (DoxX/SURF4 family)